MLTDGAALALAAFAAWMARRPPSARHSYGLGRAEVLAALVNAVTMLVIAGAIGYEALARWQSPPPVKGGAAALIAAVGLVMNLVILRRLSPHRHDLNTRAAMLHVVGDAMGSAAALVAGLVIALSGWLPIDALASAAIGLLIAVSALRLTRESLHALMEGVPARRFGRRHRPRDGASRRRDLGARPARVDALGQPHRALARTWWSAACANGTASWARCSAACTRNSGSTTSPCSPSPTPGRWCATRLARPESDEGAGDAGDADQGDDAPRRACGASGRAPSCGRRRRSRSGGTGGRLRRCSSVPRRCGPFAWTVH